MRRPSCNAMRVVPWILMAAATGSSGCALFAQVHAKPPRDTAGAPQPAPADERTTAEVEAALQSYSRAMKAMDVDAVAACFTADGELVDAGEPVHRGPEDIRTFLSAFKDVEVEANDHVTESIAVLGTTAKQTGTYRQRATVGGETVEVRGRFTADWVRQADGRWLLSRMATEPAP